MTNDTVPRLSESLDFEGDHVVVTGVTGAIGERIASEFAKAGAFVTGIDISEPKDGDWKRNGNFFNYDVSDPDQVSDVVAKAIKHRQEIDILVNNAGINRLGTAEDLSVSEWNSVINTNLRGTFLMTKFSLSSLRETKGVVVNIASGAGLHASPEYAAYGPSKAGMINLTKQTAIDYANDEIRVNAVAPGVIEAGMALEELGDEETAKRKESMTPLNRFGQPMDVANVAIFLASDAASFITGTTIVTDGGLNA